MQKGKWVTVALWFLSVTGLATAYDPGYVWEYRYGWNGDGLMGAFHSWETPPTWQMDSNSHNAKIGQSFVQASGSEPLQLRWVSPITGVVDVTIMATGKGETVSAHFGIMENIKMTM